MSASGCARQNSTSPDQTEHSPWRLASEYTGPIRYSRETGGSGPPLSRHSKVAASVCTPKEKRTNLIGLDATLVVVSARSSTRAYASTRASASCTRRERSPLGAAVVALAGGFGAGGRLGTANVPLGCSPAIRAISHVMGEPFTPSHFLVMVKDSRTLMPAASIWPATNGVEKENAAIGGAEHHAVAVLSGNVLALVVLQGDGDRGVGRELDDFARGSLGARCGCHVGFLFSVNSLRHFRLQNVRRPRRAHRLRRHGRPLLQLVVFLRRDPQTLL